MCKGVVGRLLTAVRHFVSCRCLWLFVLLVVFDKGDILIILQENGGILSESGGVEVLRKLHALTTQKASIIMSDKSHIIQKSRMQEDPKKNHSSEWIRCPFDPNHGVPPSMILQHVEVCPFRVSEQERLAQTEGIMPLVPSIIVTGKENWDCDEPLPTDDPTAGDMNYILWRSLRGLSKSDLENHWAKERLSRNGGPYYNQLDVHPKLPASSMIAQVRAEVREPRTLPFTFATPDCTGMQSVENAQASQQAFHAKVGLPASSNYNFTVKVETGEGMPAKNYQVDFPVVGRGRGRLRPNA